jgi:hypothetical protein
MKQRILLFALLYATTLTQAQVGIGTNTPNASSQLDVSSTSKGFLPPRMTAAQRNAISTPVAGLMVWCSNCGSKGEIQIYDGTEWVNFIGGSRQMSAATFAKLGSDIDGEASNDQSGNAVAFSSDGTTVAICAPNNDGSGTEAGQVRVYKNNAGNWTQIGADIDGEAAGDNSGYSVSISSDGTTVAIGAPLNDGSGTNAGHVRVYQYNSSIRNWTQIGADIDGEAADDYSGYSVSISSDGTTVAIGAPLNDGSVPEAGQVRVYKNNAGNWTQIGVDINGEGGTDLSGYSVSISSDGTTVAIGAPSNDGSGTDAGQVRVYQYNSSTSIWTPIGADIDGEAAGDFFGNSVSISSDGTTLAIGARLNDGSGIDAGQVRVYKSNAGNWTQIGADMDGEAAGDNFGYFVSISSDGTTVAIGAPHNDGSGTAAGHVRVYKNNAGTWTQIGADFDGEAAGDFFGNSVSISSDGTKVAIGAPRNDGSGPDAGQVIVYLNIGSL